MAVAESSWITLLFVLLIQKLVVLIRILLSHKQMIQLLLYVRSASIVAAGCSEGSIVLLYLLFAEGSFLDSMITLLIFLSAVLEFVGVISIIPYERSKL